MLTEHVYSFILYYVQGVESSSINFSFFLKEIDAF